MSEFDKLCANDTGLAELRTAIRQFLTADRDQYGWRPAVDSWLGGWDTGFSARLGDAGFIGLTEGIEDSASAGMAYPQLRMHAMGSLSGLLHVPDLACAAGYLVFRDNDWGKPQAQQLFARGIARLRGFGKPIECELLPTRRRPTDCRHSGVHRLIGFSHALKRRPVNNQIGPQKIEQRVEIASPQLHRCCRNQHHRLCVVGEDAQPLMQAGFTVAGVMGLIDDQQVKSWGRVERRQPRATHSSPTGEALQQIVVYE